MNPTENIEETDKFTEQAKKALQELAAIEGKKAFVIVLDDLKANAEMVALAFARSRKHNIDASFVPIEVNYGRDAISLYRAFKEADSPENPNQVVIALDGNLDSGDKYQYGYNVAREIARISEENGWVMPFVVGLSNQDDKNQVLANSHKDFYIASSDKIDILPMLKAVADKLG